MSDSHRRDRGALVALALALSAIIIVAAIQTWAGNPTNSQNTQPYAQGQHQGSASDTPAESNAWPQFTPQDTYAQWIMAVLTVVATGISIWAVRIVRNTLEVNRRATKAAEDAVAVTREMGEAQVRAYLCISDVTVEIEDREVMGDPPAPYLTVSVKVINGGETPARNVECSGVVAKTTGKKSIVLSMPHERMRKEDFLPGKEHDVFPHAVEL